MYLLDTHAIIWYVSGNEELSLTARKIMENEKCLFSFASLWEIAIKQAKGTLEFNIDIPRLRNVLENEDFLYLPPTEFDAERIKQLPDIHKDPFDRLLIAQAMENNLTIVTKDTKIPLYDLKTVW
ncbi:MAG: type II toxin-antitoxin system VapC family toxin [Treponema sp.]|nr:type II toxin-antitoxin system VapC family toxin [Treponema sp.]